MKQLIKKVLASTKTTIVLSIIIIVLLPFCWERIVYDFECLAGYLYGTSADNKGKLLSTILTAIGGICVIWGLWLNNKKVAEQTRQNNITVQNSNDKRFGEAIGYLNDANEGIVIGGVYALYQLAKEDSRYAPIITNIFLNYINDEKTKGMQTTIQAIFSLLFSKEKVFQIPRDRMSFKNLTINNVELYCSISKISFDCCKLTDVRIKGDGNGIITFYGCTLNKLTICNFQETNVVKGFFGSSTVLNDVKSSIYILSNIVYNCNVYIPQIYSCMITIDYLFGYLDLYSSIILNLSINKIGKNFPNSKVSVNYVHNIGKEAGDDMDNAVKRGLIEFTKISEADFIVKKQWFGDC